ncbi:MAG: type II CRISPR RNA-guided endonuclease Cas9 [Leptotrichiaceae bacterium]|nr:type II CRISPR RNA-guided endonuclease Cas9 [Leptotrichiaceae bacterium]MBP9595447.1 type II CRISPR RNA-guided endonuclease Cas9 [Fusobacteriaceae bacterium]
MDINYRMGLNIGINFIGWSIMNIDTNRIEKTGVRCFDTAEQPNNGDSLFLNRRLVRGQRRTLRRRRYRLERIRNLFLKERLITKEEISKYFGEFPKLSSENKSPWKLRVEALDRRLSSLELARALYHIAKKRGFLSTKNRNNKQEELGKLLKGVRQTHSLLEAKEYGSVAQMVVSDNEFLERIKNKPNDYNHTFSRTDIENEVNLIFENQIKLGVVFSGNFKENFLRIFNSQRTFDEGPNSPSPYYCENGQIDRMRGKCCFEKKENRASIGCFSYEKFIVLSRLSKITLETNGSLKKINKQQIEIILNRLKSKKELYLKDLKSILEIEKAIKISGNDCSDDELKLFEFKSYHKIKQCFLEYDETSWDKILEKDIDTIADVIHFFKDRKAKEKELIKLQIPNEVIEKLTELDFLKSSHLSLNALKKINSKLEKGLSYFEACKELGYIDNTTEKTLFLPKFDKNEINNPIVLRAFSQGRKIINQIIRAYGSPMSISFKLDNVLDKSFKDRKEFEIIKKQFQYKQNKLIENFKDSFLREPVDRTELMKYKLYLEQDRKCLLTNKVFDLRRLINEKDYAYIDYIIPYSKSFNTSENNLILLFAEEWINKNNRTPCEYFEKDLIKWLEFKNQINSSNISSKKIKNLLTLSITDSYTKNQKHKYLEDSSYFGKYFENFVGNRIFYKKSTSQNRNIYKTSNNLISYLRNELSVLDETYSYNDLYFALDAILASCISSAVINKIEDYENKKSDYLLSVLDREISLLQEYFKEELNIINLENIKNILDTAIVSRSVKRKGKGLIHDYTIRSKKLMTKGIDYTYVRKLVSNITILDIETTKNTPLYLTDKKSYDFLLSNLLESKKTNYFYKPSINNKGQKVEKMRIASKEGVSGIKVHKGIAANGNIIRIDLFKKNNKYYFIPIYIHHLIRENLPDKVVNGKDEVFWEKIDDSFIFCFALYPNDYIKIRKKNIEIEGYFLKANRRTNSLSIYNHKDKENIISSIGIRNLESIIKYEITVLGNKHEIKHSSKRIK